MLGRIDPAAEQHQQAGHQRKHREQAEQDRLDQHHGHIQADAKVHKAQGSQAADGGQRARRDLGNGLRQSRNARLARGLRLVLIAEAVAQNNGVVDSQRQLQHHRDRVRDKADLAAQKVCALIEDRRRAEGHHQHGDLGIGAAGQCQHDHNDDGRHHNDHAHFLVKVSRGIHAHLRVDVGIIPGQLVAHALQGFFADLLVLGAVKGHLKQGRRAAEVVVLVLKLHFAHAVYLFQLLRKVQRHIIGDVIHHHLRRAVGHKVVVHDRKALPGLGSIRQVGGNVVFHLHPPLGYDAENDGKYIQKKKQIALIHDQRSQLFHAAAFLLFFGLHLGHPSFCRVSLCHNIRYRRPSLRPFPAAALYLIPVSHPCIIIRCP